MRSSNSAPAGDRKAFLGAAPRVPRDPMNCPKCGTDLPANASYCTTCGASIGATELDRLAKDLARAARRAVDVGVGAVDRAAKEIGPVVDKAAKKVGPAIGEAEEAARATKQVAEKAMKAAKPAVAKAAEATEKAARKVKDRAKQG